MDEYTCTVSVCVYGWHELCRIDVPRHGSLFDAVHAVVAGHYEIIYRGTVLVTRRMTTTLTARKMRCRVGRLCYEQFLNKEIYKTVKKLCVYGSDNLCKSVSNVWSVVFAGMGI